MSHSMDRYTTALRIDEVNQCIQHLNNYRLQKAARLLQQRASYLQRIHDAQVTAACALTTTDED